MQGSVESNSLQVALSSLDHYRFFPASGADQAVPDVFPALADHGSRRHQHLASSEVKTIRLSQTYLDAPYEVEVREFEPVEGDMLEEKWTSNGTIKVHKIPRYALADMKKAALVLQNFIQGSIGTYISGTVGLSDQLIWQTYLFAFKHARDAKVRLDPWCRSSCLT